MLLWVRVCYTTVVANETPKLPLLGFGLLK